MFTYSPRRPAMLLMATAALATAILRCARLYLIQQSLCRSHLLLTGDPALVAPDGSIIDQSLCKANGIQADLALVSGVFEVGTLLCGLLATPVWTRLAGRLGRQSVLVVNVVGMVVGGAYGTAVCYFHGAFDIRMIWLGGLSELLGGGLPVRNALLYTYIAEGKAGALSDTLYHLSAFVLAMNFFGTLAGAALLDVDVWLLSFIGVAVSALTIPMALLLRTPRGLRARAISGGVLAPLRSYSSLPQDDDDDDNDEGEGEDAKGSGLWHSMAGEMSKSAQLLVTLLRDPLTRVTLLLYLSNETAIFVRVTFPQWAVTRFGWSLSQVNALGSMSILINGTVLVCMPYMSRRLVQRVAGSQQRVDAWVTKGSLYFNMTGIFLVGVAPGSTLYIAAMALYCLGPGLGDSLRSFATSAMGDAEGVRRLYMGISMMETIAGLVGTTLWSMVFSVGVRAGGAAMGNISFFAAGGLLCYSLWLVHVLHRLVDRKQVTVPTLGGEEQQSDRQEEEDQR